FIYPDHGIATVNQLTVPVGTPIRFELTSSGVMNSFFVPQLGGQIYTMAGGGGPNFFPRGHPRDQPGEVAKYKGAGVFATGFKGESRPARQCAQGGGGHRDPRPPSGWP